MNRNGEHDPLDEAPWLRQLKGRPSPFVVSEEFFARFPHEVQAQVMHRNAPVQSLWQRRLMWSLGVVTVLLAIWWAMPSTRDTIRTEEIALDIHPDELPVNDQLVWEAYASDEGSLFGEVMVDLEEQEMIAFLEHENIDVELLMAELQ